MWAFQLIGASAARRRARGGGEPGGRIGNGEPGEFDVEQLLSLFVERATHTQAAGSAAARQPPITRTSRAAIEALGTITADDSHDGESCTICFEELDSGADPCPFSTLSFTFLPFL